MKLRDVKIFFLFFLFSSVTQLYAEQKSDTLKKIKSSRLLSFTHEYYWGGVFREFYFPQYFIIEAAKRKTISIYGGGSEAGRLIPVNSDSLFTRIESTSLEVFDANGDITMVNKTDTIKIGGIVCEGYSFEEKLFADERLMNLYLTTAGIKLISPPKYQETADTIGSPFLYFVPPIDSTVFSDDCLLFKNQIDTIVISALNAADQKTLNSIFSSCIQWCADEKRTMQQNGIPLTKKQAKKLLKTLKEKKITESIHSVFLFNDWHFNPANCAMGKRIKSAELRDASGNVIFRFLF